MSKKLNKLVDINGLREFKNKIVGTDSAYVQTSAVDQTIGGTKTFSKPIAGSVTGSSGSCTGNAATATTATTAKACTGNAATATKLATARSLWGNNFDGSAAITGSITGTPCIEFSPSTTTSYNGGYLDFHYNQSTADYTSRIIESASGTLSINNVTITTGKVVTATTFNGALIGNVTGNCSGSSGSCTGNAATSTKLATARTIALSGAATGTATGFDGSGNITIPVTALAASAIKAQWYAAFPDGAEAHNAMWGGRNITAAFNNGTVSEHIADGTFKDIFPGDYITKSVTISGKTYDVTWVVADCDYWINKGVTAMTAHHVVIVPQTYIFKANMNNDNVTTGGYAGSRMYRETIPACVTGIVNAFGASHILTFRDLITRAVNTASISSGAPFWTGASSDSDGYDTQCNLMCERMVYGMPAFSSSGYDAGAATRQFSAFRLSEKAINYNRAWYWLRDVVSSGSFATVFTAGYARAHGASDVLGVRPFALLK